MKAGKIIWGLILVSFGAVLLLDNLEIINFNWNVIWRYWPAILILWGVSMIISRNDSRTGKLVTVIVTSIVVGSVIYAGLHSGRDRYIVDEVRIPGRDRVTQSTFVEEYTPGVRRAELNITGGATSYFISETTGNLFNASVSRGSGSYSLRKLSRDSIETLNFRMTGRGTWRMDGENKAIIRLNRIPLWDIYVKLGAGETNFDLTPFKINALTFEGGAASFRAKLGIPEKTTNVRIRSGVSDVSISIPRSAGGQIRLRTGLSSRDFAGFEKQADGTYTTPNFNSSARKIIINMDGGLSSFEVIRY